MLSPQNLLINGGIFTQNVKTNSKGFDLLAQNVATQARHDRGGPSDPAKCHPDTRVAILTDLEEWASGETYTYPIKWMTGSAGVGKTAIMRTTAETLKARKLLVADFFFWRTGERCNNAEFFIATLAYQISISIPETRPYIERAIEEDPHIFFQNLEAQSQALIVQPITLLLHDRCLPPNYPRVLMIDGLDECLEAGKQSQDVEKQCEVLRVLYWTLNQLPTPFFLLVASRPENHIQNVFDTILKNRSSVIMLNDSHNADADIRTFYNDKFREIRERQSVRSCLPSTEWPSQSTLDELVVRASGQFIYASTVVKFVGVSNKNPLKQLDAILDMKVRGKRRPFQALDLLYSTIFSVIDKEDLPATLRILGILLIGRFSDPRESFSPNVFLPSFWDHFLGLCPGDVQCLMLGLESVLSSQGPKGTTFHFYHASLQDFLFDSSRSELLYIDRDMVHEDLVKQAIHHLSTTDDDAAVYIILRMPAWFGSANPSTQLYDAIDQGGVSASPRCLKFVYPVFLQAIKISRFSETQKNELYKRKLDAYHTQLKNILSVYLTEERLVFLIIAGVKRNFLLDDLYKLINETADFPPELARIDRDQGFYINEANVLDSLPHGASLKGYYFFSEAVVDLLTAMPERGDMYAKAASFLIRFLSHYPNYSDLDRMNTLERETHDLLKHFLSLASTQQELSDCLKNNPIPVDIFGREIQNVINEYILRVERSLQQPTSQEETIGTTKKWSIFRALSTRILAICGKRGKRKRKS